MIFLVWVDFGGWFFLLWLIVTFGSLWVFTVLRVLGRQYLHSPSDPKELLACIRKSSSWTIFGNMQGILGDRYFTFRSSVGVCGSLFWPLLKCIGAKHTEYGGFQGGHISMKFHLNSRQLKKQVGTKQLHSRHDIFCVLGLWQSNTTQDTLVKTLECHCNRNLGRLNAPEFYSDWLLPI